MRRPPFRAVLHALLALSWALPACAAQDDGDSLVARDRRMIEAELEAMPPQRPGHPDLYVVGFAGDGHEDVFRNEVRHLERLMAERFGAGGRILTLINHPDSLGDEAPRPLATLDNLRLALGGIGAAMDRDEDLLLLFITTHGTEEHELVVQLEPMADEGIVAADLRAALDEAGIRNRVLVVSACFSGGFLPELRGPDTLLITAAREDRTSFGCGTTSSVTYFGQAWLVDGLNRHASFVAAYDDATREVSRREREGGFTPSLPQIDVGARIGQRLHAWQSTLDPGPPVAYPYPPGHASPVRDASPAPDPDDPNRE